MRRFAPSLAAVLILAACSSEPAPGNETAAEEAGVALNMSDEELADIPPPPPVPEADGGNTSEGGGGDS